MTKRESILLKILILVVLSVSLYFISFFYKAKKTELTESITKYEQQISKFKASKMNLVEEVEADTTVQEISLTQITDLVLSNLRKYNITPERYQLYENSKNPYVEFIITANTYNFISYLNYLNNNDEILPYTITFCSMKPDEDKLKVTARYSQISCKTIVSQRAHSIADICNMLRKTPKPSLEVVADREIQPSEERFEYEKNRFKTVGIITENGEKHLYIKDTNSSKLYKVPLNSIQKEDDDSFYVIINDKLTKIDK